MEIRTLRDLKRLRTLWHRNSESKETVVVFKFVTARRRSPIFWEAGDKPIYYPKGRVITKARRNCDSTGRDCGAGINVATRAWAQAHQRAWAANRLIALRIRICDIVAIPYWQPYGQGGKFRVCCAKVLT